MKALRSGFVIFVLVVLQTAIFANLGLAKAHPDIVLLVPIAVGISYGRDMGAIAGFVSGFVLDLAVHGTPLGFFALGYTLVGYLVGMTESTVLRSAWWIPVLTAFGASLIGVATLAVLANVLGLEIALDTHLAVVAVVVAVVNSLLVLPMLRVVRWALPPTRSGRLVIS